MKPNGVIHYDFNFFGLTLPLQKLAFVPRFSSFVIGIQSFQVLEGLFKEIMSDFSQIKWFQVGETWKALLPHTTHHSKAKLVTISTNPHGLMTPICQRPKQKPSTEPSS